MELGRKLMQGGKSECSFFGICAVRDRKLVDIPIGMVASTLA